MTSHQIKLTWLFKQWGRKREVPIICGLLLCRKLRQSKDYQTRLNFLLGLYHKERWRKGLICIILWGKSIFPVIITKTILTSTWHFWHHLLSCPFLYDWYELWSSFWILHSSWFSKFEPKWNFYNQKSEKKLWAFLDLLKLKIQLLNHKWMCHIRADDGFFRCPEYKDLT